MPNQFKKYFEGATRFGFPTVAEWRQAAGTGGLGPYVNEYVNYLEIKIRQHLTSPPPVPRGAKLGYVHPKWAKDCQFVVTLTAVIDACNLILRDPYRNKQLYDAAKDLKQLCGYQIVNAQVPTAEPKDNPFRNAVKEKTAHNLAKFAQVALPSSPAVDAKFFSASAAPAASSSKFKKAGKMMSKAASSSSRFPTKTTDRTYWSEMHAGTGDKRDAATTGCVGYKSWSTPPGHEWWDTTEGRLASQCLAAVSGGANLQKMTFADYMSHCQDVARSKDMITYINSNELGGFLAIYDKIKKRWFQETRYGKMTLLDTGGNPAIYAMSEDGLLFVDGQEGLPLNHVSFLRGRPVVCAGNAEFRHGELITIDNGSGHYKPGSEHLRQAIHILIHNTGNDVMHTNLVVTDVTSGQINPVRHFWTDRLLTSKHSGKGSKSLLSPR